jgi:hypothetical protein
MDPIKGTTTKRALFIGSVLLVGLMGMISMPQMIGSANATIEERGERGQGAENACKELPGATLERGQCTAPAKETTIKTCDPLFGQTPTPSSSGKCTASSTQAAGRDTNAAEAACKAMPGGSAQTENAGPGQKKVTCTYDAKTTTTFTCPNDIKPTPETHLCITKPGDRTEEEV